MKNYKLNLIEWLWKTDSHEKQKPQRFGRYAVMLLMLLTLCVGQMWANYDKFRGNIYYNNSSSNWSNVSLIVGKDDYSCAYLFSHLDHTKLYYKWIDYSDWNDCYFFNENWGASNCNDQKPYDRVKNKTRWQPYKKNYNTGDRLYFNGTDASSAAGDLPLYTATLKVRKSTDGGSYATISSGSWPATINLKGTYMDGNSSTGQSNFNTSSGSEATYKDIPVTGEVTLTLGASADSKYEFAGWNTSSSGPSSTTTPKTYNITGTTTYYAFFRTKEYTVSYNGGANATGGSHADDTKYHGTTLTLPGATFTRTGYTQTGWATSDGGAQVYALSASYTANAAVTLYPVWTENMSTVSFVASPTGKGTFQVNSSTVTSTTAGVTTTKAVTAVPGTGYTFGSWAITGGATISSTSTNPTTVTGKGAGAAATLTCTFNPKNYTVTLDKNGGDSDGEITTTYNSSSTLSFSEASYASHSCDGYFDDPNDGEGNMIIDSDGNLVNTTVSGWLSSGAWVKDAADITLYAHWTYNPTLYNVTFGVGTSLGSLSAEVTSSGDAISNGDDLVSGTGVTFTASPNTGYVVEGWYTDAACTEGKHDAGETTYSIASLSGDVTVYVKFVEKTWSVAFAAGTGGTVTTPNSTPQTVGQVTGISIAATPGTGYTFASWSSSSGGSFTSGTSTNSNTFKPTANTTVTASFTETMHTITISGGTAASTTAGVATTGSATAAAPAAGKKFTGWTLGNGVTLSGGALTDRTINFTATQASSVTANYANRASVKMYFAKPTKLSWTKVYAYAYKSSDASVRNAAYPGVELENTEVINCVTYYTYQYYTEGDGIGGATTGNSAWNRIIFGDNNDARKTGDLTISNGHYYYKTSTGTGETAALTSGWGIKCSKNSFGAPYLITHDCANNKGTVDINLTGGQNYTFKVYDAINDQWWSNSTSHGSSNPITVSMATASTVYDDANNMQVNTALTGDYTFEISATNAANPKIKVTFPEIYAIVGSFNSWNTETNPLSMDGNTGTADIVLAPSGSNYTLKVVDDGSMYGKNSTTITGTTTVSSMSTSGANINLTADIYPASANPSYGFSYNKSTKALTVTYPAAHTVTYGVGTHAGTASVTSSISVASGKKILDSQSITFSKGDLITGYTWKGWYNNNAGTGDALGTGATYTSSSRAANTSVYACYDLVNYTITYNLNGGSNPVSPAPATSYTKESAEITLPTPTKTGYTFNGWYENADLSTGGVKTTIPAGSTGNKVYYAKWTPITYTIHFNGNGNTSGSMSNQTGVTYDAATTITANAFVKTGYNFAGWGTTQERANAGTIDRTDGAAHGNLASTQGATAQLWAVWTPKQSAITFDYQTGVTGYNSSGNITNATGLMGTYDADMTALTGTMPSADEGYAFTGFYDAPNGGTKYYNADGTSAHAWDKDTESGTTLYARWEKAEITALTLDAGTVEPGNTVGVTPTISPAPAGTTSICWEVQYAATGNPLSPQPGMTWSAGKLTFDAPAASGLYKIVATLKTGDDCDGGTTLSSSFVNVQVAGSHTVTIAYKYSSTEIAASTSTTGRPLEWTEVVAHDIFGYSFTSWTAGDGITIRDTTAARLTELQAEDPTIVAVQRMKATYDGILTANYTPKKLIYFKNTLGWENVYVNFYKSDYWNSTKGSGNNGVPVQNKTMTRLGETDIWYYDYGSDNFTGYTNTKPTNYVSFTSAPQSSAENFWASGSISVSYPARRADDLADKANETGFYEATPMFVPLEGQTAVTKNESDGGKALYYNSGYWTKYLPGTGYTLEIYNAAGNSKLKEFDFTSADELIPMKVVADLEAGQTYKFQIKRHGDVYLGNSGTMTYANHGQSTPWEMTATDFSMCGITTTAYGDYTFNFTYSANASNEYRLRISVDYPVADGDYRLVYKDAVHTKIHPSAIIPKENDGTAIVSFFVRHDQNPKLYIQQASVDGSGNITWNEYPTSGTPTNQITGDIASAIDATGVYNFNLSMDGSGDMSVASAEPYTGNYYIRTDAANSKWDNYRTDPDHLMTYSEYSITHGGYSHYYTHWVNKDDVGRKNVKFVIANDYSPCISDTLARETASGTWANIATFMEEGGDLKRSANVRFMWNSATNEVSRAYIDGAQEDGSQFLLLLSDDSMIKQGGATKTQVTFNDNGNWLYEANISALPNAQIKLKSTWGEGTTIDQYFKGASDATETLVGGSGDDEYNFRLIYDFKTNRLLASYVPATGTISTNVEINADVMFVREHQGDIAQLTFSGSGAISKIETAYGVMRFNKWTINNKDKSTHDPLPLPQPSRFERDIFYVSFPFRVNLEEVFGFGTYGTHWIIEEYDGASRAEKGFWADSKSFWKFITNRKGKFLEPNKGYILALDLDELGESSSVWANTDQVELYFPSYGTMPNITSSSVTYEIPAHTCNIGPRFEGGDDRRIKDSHWNVMSVPTYVNTNDVTFANTDWITTADDEHLGPNFLYTVNWSDNSLTATSGKDYTYKAMHAYIVQYCGNVTWSTSVSPATAPRRNPDAPKDVEYRLELSQNDVAVDQTFIRLSDDEHVTTGFEFNYDMSKEFNKNKASIYTIVSTMIDGDLSITETAGNTLPMTEQTTVVPVGVIAKTAGDYTFAIPEGTNGVGVTLIDIETGIRTPLSALDYTVNLSAGTYNERFVLEISPVQQTPTGIENSEVSHQHSDVRKVLIDGILYIVKDGKMFDATGALVK